MENFISLAQTEISIAVVIVNLLVSFVLSIFIAYTYKKTHQGLSFSTTFMTTLVVIGILGSVVMMVVAQNLIGAFALLGAFSLIRFRTILKDTRDIAFLFFALVIGVSVGTSNYIIAVVSTIFVIGVIHLLRKINFGSFIDGGYLLTVVADKTFSPNKFEELKDKLESAKLLHSKSISEEEWEYSFDITLSHGISPEEITKALQATDGVKQTDLLSSTHATEY